MTSSDGQSMIVAPRDHGKKKQQVLEKEKLTLEQRTNQDSLLLLHHETTVKKQQVIEKEKLTLEQRKNQDEININA
jgi:hypothetical protein